MDLAVCAGWLWSGWGEWLIGRFLLQPIKVTVTEGLKWSVGVGVGDGQRAEMRHC